MIIYCTNLRTLVKNTVICTPLLVCTCPQNLILTGQFMAVLEGLTDGWMDKQKTQNFI